MLSKSAAASARLITLVLLTATVAAAQTSIPAKPAATAGGDWKVSLHSDHVVPVGMTLVQDAARLTGTIMLPGNEVPLTGQIVDGVISLKGKVENATVSHGTGGGSGEVTITATLKEDGTLEGTFTGGRGTIKLTAEKLGRRPVRSAPVPADPGVSGSVAGRWTMSIEMSGNVMAAVLALTVDGEKVAGTLTSDHSGELQVAGTFVKGALVFTGGSGDGPALTFTGALTDGDTLAGKLNGQMGELSWTAPRAKK